MNAPRRWELCISILIAFALIAFGVGLAAGEEHSTAGDQIHRQETGLFAKVPDKARLRSNPLVNDPDAVLAGKKLFEQHCAQCHGQEAKGGAKAPSLRAGAMTKATPGTIFWIMSNGVVRRGMPVWSKLPEPQRWQIVSYIKSLSPLTYGGQPLAKDDTVGTSADQH